MIGPAAVTFPIRIQRGLRPILLPFGVRGAATAAATFDGNRFSARFGFFRAESDLSNIERWDITGPYRWWRAAGVRRTIAKPELTFGGSAHGGVRIRFRSPIRVWRMGVRDLFMTMDDLEGFAAALAARGIPGADLRGSR